MANRWVNSGNGDRLYLGVGWGGADFKLTADCDYSHKIKRCCSLEEKLWQPRQHIEKQRDITLPTKIRLSSRHVRMWELDYEESWAPKTWCFWIVVLEETLESPSDCKEIQSVDPKGNQHWIFFGKTDAESETPILWPCNAKSWLIGKGPDAGEDWKWEEKGMAEDEMTGWHHWLDGHEFELAPAVGGKQRSLACFSPWGHKDSYRTEQQDWTEQLR